MKRFLFIVEKAHGNYSAYVPDLPGCVATGRTLKETRANIHAAVRMHLQGLAEEGSPPPEPQTRAGYVPTSAAR